MSETDFLSNCSKSISLSASILISSNFRFFPRTISTISPLTGEQKSTFSAVLSCIKGVPAFTLSPTFTSSLGREIPTKSVGLRAKVSGCSNSVIFFTALPTRFMSNPFLSLIVCDMKLELDVFLKIGHKNSKKKFK